MIDRTKLLHGEKVRLTALRKNDASAVARWDLDTGVQRLFDARPAHPRSEEEIIRHLNAVEQGDRSMAFGIRRVDADPLIGILELDEILWSHRVCGISILIGDRENWGRGYGFEAALLGLAFAFEELNLHRVTATIFSYNKRSIALFEKLGFEREGVFREFLERDGRRHDMLLYGLLQHEWRGR